MFVFQINTLANLPAASKLTIAEMESKFLKINPTDLESLRAFQSDLADFSKNNDKKSKAFAHHAAAWGAAYTEGIVSNLESKLNELKKEGKNADLEKQTQYLLDRAKVISGAFMTTGAKAIKAIAPNDNEFSEHSKHYEHLIDVTNNWRAFSSAPLPPDPIYNFVEILDKAWKTKEQSSMAFSRVNLDENSFVFKSREQADQFATKMLVNSDLPADFKINYIDVVKDRFKSNTANGKTLVDGACVVSFTCKYNPSKASPSLKSADAVSNPTEFIQPVSSTSMPANVSAQLTGSVGKVYSDSEIVQYAQGKMDGSSIGYGKVRVYGTAASYYGKSYAIDPTKDKPKAKDITKSTLLEVLNKYDLKIGGLSIADYLEKNDMTMADYLATSDGQKFIKQFNSDAPQIYGSASMEVFYDGNNYSTLAKAINSNWALAKKRAELISEQILLINKSLLTRDPPLQTLNVEKIQTSVYFFQNLDQMEAGKSTTVMDRLIEDKEKLLTPELRSWLKENRNNLRGEEHMASLLEYVKNSTSEEAEGVFNKLSGALDAKDYALMNRYWQRTSNDKMGLRVENDHDPSLLVKGEIALGSRDMGISVSIDADLKNEIKPVESRWVKVKPGETANVEINIDAIPSFAGLLKCTNAYLVDKQDSSAPPITLEEKEDGKWLARNLKPGDYAVVAYSQSENSVIVTPLAGRTMRVEEIIVPEKKEEPIPTIAKPKVFQVLRPLNAPTLQNTDLRLYIPTNIGVSSLTPEWFNNMFNTAFTEGLGMVYDDSGTGNYIGNPTSDQYRNFINNVLPAKLEANTANLGTIMPSGDVEKFKQFLLAGDWQSALALITDPNVKTSLGNVKNQDVLLQNITTRDLILLHAVPLTFQVQKTFDLNKPKPVGVIWEGEIENPDKLPGNIVLNDKQINSIIGLKNDGTALVEVDGKKYGVYRTMQDYGETGEKKAALSFFEMPANKHQFSLFADVNALGFAKSNYISGGKHIVPTTFGGGLAYLGEIKLSKKLSLVSGTAGGVETPFGKTAGLVERRNSSVAYIRGQGALKIPLSETLNAAFGAVAQTQFQQKYKPYSCGQATASITKSLKNADISLSLGQGFGQDEYPYQIIGLDLQYKVKKTPIKSVNLGMEVFFNNNIKQLTPGFKASIGF